MQREPALIVGLIGSILVLALEQIAGSGVVTGRGVDLVNSLVTILPLVFAAITRQLVYAPASLAFPLPVPTDAAPVPPPPAAPVPPSPVPPAQS